MKLLIDQPITYSLVYSRVYHDDITHAERVELEKHLTELKNTLKQYAVSSTCIFNHNAQYITIDAQKVSLNEIDMNALIYLIEDSFNNLNIEYAALGGKGCDFSFRLKQDK